MINFIRKLRFFHVKDRPINSAAVTPVLSNHPIECKGVTAVYDITPLKELVGENTPGFYQIITTFIEKTPQEVNLLLQAIESQDWKTMGNQAHKLKSNLKLFGLETIAAELQLLESIGKGHQPMLSLSEIQELAEKVFRVFSSAIAELPNELSTQKNP